METTDYCSYELSKALKAAGFDEPCHYHYDCDRGSHIIEPNYTTNDGEGCQYITADDLLEDSNGWQYCSAPTLAHAQKWMREVKHIDVLVWNCSCGYGWEISKADAQSRGTTLMFYNDNGEDKDSGMWLTYENALSAGIVAALQLLDNENKNK